MDSLVGVAWYAHFLEASANPAHFSASLPPPLKLWGSASWIDCVDEQDKNVKAHDAMIQYTKHLITVNSNADMLHNPSHDVFDSISVVECCVLLSKDQFQR